MHSLNSILRSLGEIIRLGASFGLGGVSFEIDADDIDRDLSYGR